jgi:hypothetical protein
MSIRQRTSSCEELSGLSSQSFGGMHLVGSKGEVTLMKKKDDNLIIIPFKDTNYKFYRTPDKVVKSIIELLKVYSNTDTRIVTVESEIDADD